MQESFYYDIPACYCVPEYTFLHAFRPCGGVRGGGSEGGGDMRGVRGRGRGVGGERRGGYYEMHRAKPGRPKHAACS